MFSEKDLVTRSMEDMAKELEELSALARQERDEYDTLNLREAALRRESVEKRLKEADLAESLWQEAERLHDEARELMRLYMENRLRAAEVQRRIDIHDEIQSLDNYDHIWREAAKARRG